MDIGERRQLAVRWNAWTAGRPSVGDFDRIHADVGLPDPAPAGYT